MDTYFHKFIDRLNTPPVTVTLTDTATILSEKNHAVLHIILDTLIGDIDADAESVAMYREIKEQLIVTMWVLEEDRTDYE